MRLPLFVAAVLSLIAVAAFSGCAWLGKGKEVSDAYANTENAKSAAFTASLSVTSPRELGKPAKTETDTVTGAVDNLDPAHPKSRYESYVDGERIYVVQPGNGRVYTQIGKQVSSGMLPKDRKMVDSVSKNKVLTAFASAFVNFRDASPLVNGEGASVPAIAADVSRVKVCGPSMRQALRALLNSSTNKKARVRVTKRETRGLSKACNKALPTPPLATFGILNGFMTDFVLDLEIEDSDEVFAVRFELHLSGLGQPQTGFNVPRASKKGKLFSAQRLGDRAEAGVARAADFGFDLGPSPAR